MARTSSTLASMVLMLAVAAQLGWAAMTSSPSGIDDRLRLEWEAVPSAKGRAVIAGYLYNDYKRPATQVVLLVEALDTSGAVAERVVRQMAEGVPPFNRTYFEVPLRSRAASYRISVSSFEWYAGGN